LGSRGREKRGFFRFISSHSRTKSNNNANSYCACLASHRVQAADASLLVLACPDAVSLETPSGPRLDVPAELAPLLTQNTFILLNKTDLLPTSALVPARATALTTTNALPQHNTWAVSLASHAGTSDFLAGLAKALQDRYHLLQDADGEDVSAPLITHARHRAHLESALQFLDAFLDTRGVEDVVLGAEELRYAAQAVGKISGMVDVEDVLDVIFSQFCIGK